MEQEAKLTGKTIIVRNFFRGSNGFLAPHHDPLEMRVRGTSVHDFRDTIGIAVVVDVPGTTSHEGGVDDEIGTDPELIVLYPPGSIQFFPAVGHGIGHVLSDVFRHDFSHGEGMIGEESPSVYFAAFDRDGFGPGDFLVMFGRSDGRILNSLEGVPTGEAGAELQPGVEDSVVLGGLVLGVFVLNGLGEGGQARLLVDGSSVAPGAAALAGDPPLDPLLLNPAQDLHDGFLPPSGVIPEAHGIRLERDALINLGAQFLVVGGGSERGGLVGLGATGIGEAGGGGSGGPADGQASIVGSLVFPRAGHVRLDLTEEPVSVLEEVNCLGPGLAEVLEGVEVWFVVGLGEAGGVGVFYGG